MAIPFLTGIDLSGNELLNVRLQNLASAPASPGDGQVWYDSSGGKITAREGGANVTFATSSHLHDDRYYTEAEADALLAGKSDTSHTHDGRYYTESEIDAMLAAINDWDAADHDAHDHSTALGTAVLADLSNVATTAPNNGNALLYNSSLSRWEPGDVSSGSHSHGDLYYTEAEVDALLAGKSDTSHSHAVSALTDTTITSVADNEVLAYNTATSQWINQTAAEAGLATASHNHDSTYYTESEVDSLLSGKSDTSHTHDTRYYTESEVDALLAGKANTSHNHDADYVELSGDTLTGFLTLHADPTSALHAATKQYVDGVASGLNWKAPVRVATTGNITLSGTQTIDGVAVAAGNRVLVKNQSTGSQNGIYVVAAGAWSRAADADASAEVNPGMATFVEEGTTQADTGWVLTNDGAVTVGTTALVFTQFTSLGMVEAGAGLTKTGNSLDVGATNASIVVGADGLSVGYEATVASPLTPNASGTTGTSNFPARRDHHHRAPTAAPSTALTPASTNAEGTGTSFARNDHSHALTTAAPPASGTGAIDIGDTAAAGTAASFARSDHQHAFAAGSAPPAVAASSATGSASTPARSDHTHAGLTRYATNVGDGTATAYVLTHNLGTRDVTVEVARNGTPWDTVYCDVERTSTTQVTLRFAAAPTAAQYRAVVVG